MTTVLETHDLLIGYEKSLMPAINVQLEQGDVVALAGPNGAGKSTLFKTITGHIPPISGNIKLFGKDLNNYDSKQRASLYSIVLTERPDDMFITVFDIVASGRYPHMGLLAKLSLHDKKIITESLEHTSTSHLINRTFVSLSDGERQKVMIAKALAQDTPLIYMDEPAAFLDYPSKVELMTLMLRLAQEHKKTILFSSHDLDMLLHNADKLWIVAPNKQLITGVPEDLVVGDYIEHYFSRKDICFNKETARFEIATTPKLTAIHVKFADNNQHLWLKHAIIRKGYKITDTNDDTFSFHISDNSIILSFNDKIINTFDNIAEAIGYLTQNIP